MSISSRAVSRVLIVLSALFTLFVFSNAFALDLGTIDPNEPGSESKTFLCVKPIEYTNNTGIPPGVQVDIQWRVGINGGAVDNNVGLAKDACSQTIDFTQVVDNVYVYKTVAIADGKESTLSSEFITVTVKRILTPKAPTGLTVQ